MTGSALAAERLVLPPDPRSASAARRLVRRTLALAGRDEWSDATELAVSEVVSNAVLHAHTDVEVVVSVRADAVRVEVLDHSPQLPAQRAYGEQATTGRGLGLVAALADRFGVEAHEGNGKTVWFSVGGGDGLTPDVDIGDAWDDDTWDDAIAGAATPPQDAGPHGGSLHGSAPGEPPAAPGSRAQLLALPVSLWLAAQQHHDALIREYVLARTGESHEGDPPAATVLAADRAQGLLAAAVEHALERALEGGAETVPLPSGHPSPLPEVPPALDVVLTVEPDDALAFAALQDTLDAAEALAARGRLLARPALAEVVAVRDWTCEQVIAQLGGVGPSPWPGIDPAHTWAPHPPEDLPQPRWDPEVVSRSDRSVVAADDGNRILAVSDSLARLTGWEREDLVGRRVVALVPPRLRDLHVAGFTRHLTTGESHVLGVPLELPVLHRDGHEVPCRFLVERLPDTGPRAVYLAWIEAAGPEGS